jgi:hypothetical protein
MSSKTKAPISFVRRLCTRTEAEQILGKQVFADAFIAGWIKPRAIKKGQTARKNAKIIYALSDVRYVEERMLAGEYPEPKHS